MGMFKRAGLAVGRALKYYLIAGLATVLPIFITGYVVVLVVQISDKLVGKYLNPILREELGFTVPGLGVVFIVFVVLVAGYVSRLYVGRKLLPVGDWLLRRLPLVSQIYPSAKEFSDLVFTTKERKHFNRVVLVPYPSETSYALGFVTNESVAYLNARAGRELVSVLVPFGPTPFTGVLLYYPPQAVIDLDVPVEAAIKTIVSAGVIAPGEARARARQVEAGEGGPETGERGPHADASAQEDR